MREKEKQRADQARQGRLEQAGVDLMNAYNRGRTDPSHMAVNGHDTAPGYEFFIDSPSGETIRVTVGWDSPT